MQATVDEDYFVSDIDSPFGRLLKGKFTNNRFRLMTVEGSPLKYDSRVKARVYKIIPMPEEYRDRRRSGVEVWE
jgi:hypothetical protein